MSTIIKRTSEILEVETDPLAVTEIARRSRGTPRIANRLVKRLRDFALVKGEGKVDHELSRTTLKVLGMDEEGLDKMDRDILRTIIEKYEGGPVGVGTIAVSLGESKETIEEAYEPFLIRKGLLKRTLRGRVATPHAYRHLGIKTSEGGLFDG